MKRTLRNAPARIDGVVGQEPVVPASAVAHSAPQPLAHASRCGTPLELHIVLLRVVIIRNQALVIYAAQPDDADYSLFLSSCLARAHAKSRRFVIFPWRRSSAGIAKA